MSNNKLAVLGAALTVFLLVSCASAPQRELSREDSPYAALPNGQDPLNPDQLAPMFAHTDNKPGEGLIQYTERQRGHALNVLELSGGGQNGAFGAGFLKGWRESGDRPQFDIVTGVSTGALLATHAFLGTPADDAVLEKLFTGITKKDIYRDRGKLAVVFGADSLLDTAPLKALIDKYVTAEVLQRVAAAYDDNRSLWIGTTNLDYSQTWVWNLTLMAKRGGADALDLYRKVLLASASFPVAFPPVEINNHLFADGAIRANVMAVGERQGSERPEKPLYGPGNVYLIHNGKFEASPLAASKNFTALAGAAIGDMMDSSMEGILLRSFYLTRANGYRFNYVHVPQHTDIGRNPLAFDPKQMRAGFDAGRALAKQANPWSNAPSLDEGDIPDWMIDDIERRGKTTGN